MTTDPRQMTHDELNREAASGVTRYSLRFHATPTAVIGSANADPNGPWVAWADVEADLLALRETVRVLGEEIRAIWAVYNANLDAVTDGGCSLHNAIAAAVDARNANPGARAAVEGTA